MTPGRIQALDAFRGIAALWVVIYHVTLRYPYFMVGDPTPPTPLLAGYPGFFFASEMGLIPVLWFFLISGFVITWTLDRCRTAMDFVVSRFSRLYPAYWASMAVAVLLGLLVPLPGTDLDFGQVLVNASMLQDVLGVPPIDGVYWSLGIELRFYVFACAVFALGQWRRVHLFAFAWMAVCLAVAVANARDIWVPWRLQELLVARYAPLLGAGMMLYQLWRRQHVAWSWATLGLAVAALPLVFRGAPALSCVVVMALIGWAAHGGLRWLAAAPLVLLGTLSYPLYLSHETVTFTVMRALDAAGWPHLAGQAAAVGTALVLAAAISFGAERPALRAIRRLWRAAEGPGTALNPQIPSHKFERS